MKGISTSDDKPRGRRKIERLHHSGDNEKSRRLPAVPNVKLI